LAPSTVARFPGSGFGKRYVSVRGRKEVAKIAGKIKPVSALETADRALTESK